LKKKEEKKEKERGKREEKASVGAAHDEL